MSRVLILPARWNHATTRPVSKPLPLMDRLRMAYHVQKARYRVLLRVCVFRADAWMEENPRQTLALTLVGTAAAVLLFVRFVLPRFI